MDEFRLPLRILELGSSAGLNLSWDRYGYAGADWSWGPEDARVRFSGIYEGRPALESPALVVERRGCDSAPLDPADPDTRLALRSSVWADHSQRFERLDAALEVARTHPTPVDRADVVDWLTMKLEQHCEGVATVVLHSILWQYLDVPRRERIRALLEAVGAEARPSSPFAWLRMEPPGELASVTLTTWPGGRKRVVALSGYHGRPVRILVPRAAV